jgi:hypothetical protein
MEVDQQVYVAIRSEVVSDGGAEKGKLAHLILATELLDFISRKEHVCVPHGSSQRNA